MFGCTWSLVDTNTTELLLFWILWIILTFISWISGIFGAYLIFVKKYRAINTKNNNSDSFCENNYNCLKSKNLFFSLMMMFCVAIPLAQTFGCLLGPFYISFWVPAKNVDYFDTDDDPDNGLNCGQLGFWKTFVVFAPISHCVNDICYNLVLIIYYVRLYWIFKGSLFELSNYQQILFKLLISSVVLFSFIRHMINFFYEFAGHNISVYLWNIYIIYYAFVSLCMLIILRRQFLKMVGWFSRINKVSSPSISSVKIGSGTSPTLAAVSDINIKVNVNMKINMNVATMSVDERDERDLEHSSNDTTNVKNNNDNVNANASVSVLSSSDITSIATRKAGTSISHSNNHNHNYNYNMPSRENRALLDASKLMKRFTVLAIWCLGSNLLVIIFSISTFAALTTESTVNTIWLHGIYWTFWFLDTSINLFCILLQYDFGINQHCYNSICKQCESKKLI